MKSSKIMHFIHDIQYNFLIFRDIQRSGYICGSEKIE